MIGQSGFRKLIQKMHQIIIRKLIQKIHHQDQKDSRSKHFPKIKKIQKKRSQDSEDSSSSRKNEHNLISCTTKKIQTLPKILPNITVPNIIENSKRFRNDNHHQDFAQHKN